MPLKPARRAVAAPCRPALFLLEDRLTPALSFRFDYSLDAGGFFADPGRRAALEQAGQELAGRIVTPLAAIAPGGANKWSAIFNDPSNGSQVKIANPGVPADTLVIYVGGMVGTGGEAGQGGPGGYSASGGAAFLTAVSGRNTAGFASWGGSIGFDRNSNWYFGRDANGRAPGQVDFVTVATHELGHTLGFGTSKQWDNLIQGDQFVGANVRALGGARLSPDREHFAQGTKFNGDSVSMQPVLDTSHRVGFSDLDYAALADIGWQLSPPLTDTPLARIAVAAGPDDPLNPAPAPAPASAAVAVSAPTPVAEAGQLVLFSGPNSGTVQAYSTGAGGTLSPLGGAFRPFGDFGGAVRTATADVNGDGAADWILGTGPGGGSGVRVLDGRTFQDLVPQYQAFEAGFTGGVYLAAADFDGDGRAEVIVTPDEGGGPRVQVLSVAGGQLQKRADFYGLSDPNFRGGARVAAGDLNRDGVPDLAVAAGFGGGPRVSLLDGRGVLSGGNAHLAGDFFAFDQALRNGTYLAIGDTDGDGYGDLILGAGPGGGPRVLTLSGQRLATGDANAALNSPLGNTFAGDPASRGGVRVAAKDFDGNGQSEVIAGAGQGGAAYVLNPKAGYATTAAVAPFGELGADGIYVG